MGILDKFQDGEAKKSLSEDLKSKVGISESGFAEDDEEVQTENLKIQEGSENPKKKKEDEKAKANESTNVIEGKPIKRKEVEEKYENLELSESSELNNNMTKDELEAFVTNFSKNYKQSEKENRIVRLEKKNYKSVIKLKVDKVAMSEFINFAIHFTLKSSSYADIVKLLKKPK
jgi:hypothetical protein